MATNTTHFQGPRTITGNDDWRASLRALDCAWPGVLAKDNSDIDLTAGPTIYGKVKGGTILAKDSLGALHPCGLTEVAATLSADNVVEVGDDRNFYVGDQIAIVHERTTRAFGITAEADTETLRTDSPNGLRVNDKVTLSALTGGTGLTATDYLVAAIATAPPALPVAGEADTEVLTTPTAHGLHVGDTVTFTSFDDTTDAVEGTYVVATVPSTTTFTCTAFAFTTDIVNGTVAFEDRSSTDFTLKTMAGVAVTFTTDVTAGTLTIQGDGQPENLTGTRYISAIDRDTHEITFSGAAADAAIGDLVIKVNAYKPCGVLINTVSTVVYDPDGDYQTYNVEVSYSYAADLRADYCPGLGSKLTEILAGGVYVDPLTGAKVVPEYTGFIVKDW